MNRILRRLAPDTMQSTYITGQKRVGKSSLAHAVQGEISSGYHSSNYKVLYLECGEILHTSGQETLEALGLRLEELLTDALPRSVDWVSSDYKSSLAPLNRLLDKLREVCPDHRFVVILDEFDEINESLYRHGELANTFFLNLRTISSKRNISFVLVGAERMPYVMAAQGEKLNRFEREWLDSFDRESEWADYLALVRTPVTEVVEAYESALYALFNYTNGHPYFTKMLCASVYECAVEAKDAEITGGEIDRAARRIVATLDTNVFAHYWRDGIRGDSKDIEITSLKRCRLLLAWARTARAKKPPKVEAIRANVHSTGLDGGEVLPFLEDFCRRGVFKESAGEYWPTVDLFANWLLESGFSMLVTDQLGDELAEAKQQAEDHAYVHAKELVDVTSQWDLYQGRPITPEQVRAWLDQLDSNVERRILFKLLRHLRFFKDAEIREKFRSAHSWIKQRLPVVVKTSRAQRRNDILVSYVDGPGKSGAHYAGLYANTNEIVSDNIVSPEKLAERVREFGDGNAVAVVVVDDMIGTGSNLVGKFAALSGVFNDAGIGTEVPLSVAVLTGTVAGERRVRKHLQVELPNSDLEICEILEDKHFAFTDALGLWESEDEKSHAKALLTDLGARVQKRKPLGFEDQGLLLSFSRNCPNNSLPILHGFGKTNSPWTPLFPRIRT